MNENATGLKVINVFIPSTRQLLIYSRKLVRLEEGVWEIVSSCISSTIVFLLGVIGKAAAD